MIETYKPSGAFSPLAILLLLLTVIAGIVLAGIYQLLLEWIPFIYINFLLTVGLGVALGFLGKFVVEKGHVRNAMLGGLFATVLVLSTLAGKFWIQYQRDIAATIEYVSTGNQAAGEEGMPEELARELVLAEYSFVDHIKARVEYGWSMGSGDGMPISGFFVYLIWLIEAGAVFYFSFGGTVSAAQQPYNEHAKKWANETNVILSLPIPNQAMLDQIQAADSLEGLLNIPLPEAGETNQSAAYVVSSIPGEDYLDAYLTVTLVSIKYNSKGEAEVESAPMVAYAVLPSAQRDKLLLIAEHFEATLEKLEAEAEASGEEQAGEEQAGETGEETGEESTG
jgi:hypothetical protein